MHKPQGKASRTLFLPRKRSGGRFIGETVDAFDESITRQISGLIEKLLGTLAAPLAAEPRPNEVFKAFDANKDGSLNINEFRTYLKEPKERMPFLNRIFLTMDNDAMDGAERVNTYGVGELDMFEFFVVDQCPLHRWRTNDPHTGRLLLHLLVTERRLRHTVYLGLVRSQKDRRDR